MARVRSAGKFGRKTGPSRFAAELRLSDYLVRDPFPTVDLSTTSDFTSGISSWGMLGNDQYGCCGVAGDAHLNMANGWTAKEEAPGAGNWPSAAEVVEAYFTYEGSPGGKPDPSYDKGVDLGEWLLYRTTHKLGPLDTIGGFASLDYTNTAELAGALATFGGLYCGIVVTQTDMEEFEEGLPWTNTTDTTPIGGHCVPILYRGPKWGKVVTWGAVQSFSWPWWQAFGEEAWVVFTPEQMDAPGGLFNGVNVTKLGADIKALHGRLAEAA